MDFSITRSTLSFAAGDEAEYRKTFVTLYLVILKTNVWINNSFKWVTN